MKKFIQDYLQRGWGSMNKNDFEVWIFYQLLQNDDYSLKEASDYQIAIALRIPESKVKRLRYESMLKYGLLEEQAENLFRLKILNDVLKRVQYKQVGDKVQFVVTDRLLRQYISDILSRGGRFFDTSFNTNIVSIHIDDFLFLLTQLYDKEQVGNLVKQVQNSLNNVIKELPKEPSEIFRDSLKAFCIGVLKDRVGEFTIGAMEKHMKTIAETIKAQYNKIKEK